MTDRAARVHPDAGEQKRDTGRIRGAATLQSPGGEHDMDDQALTSRIDEALDQFRGRDLVAASEIVDLLLDLRLMLLAADEEARSTAS
jgi:hypothetical protein